MQNNNNNFNNSIQLEEKINLNAQNLDCFNNYENKIKNIENKMDEISSSEKGLLNKIPNDIILLKEEINKPKILKLNPPEYFNCIIYSFKCGISSLKTLLEKYKSLKKQEKPSKFAYEMNKIDSEINELVENINSTLDFSINYFKDMLKTNFKNKKEIKINAFDEELLKNLNTLNVKSNNIKEKIEKLKSKKNNVKNEVSFEAISFTNKYDLQNSGLFFEKDINYKNSEISNNNSENSLQKSFNLILNEIDFISNNCDNNNNISDELFNLIFDDALNENLDYDLYNENFNKNQIIDLENNNFNNIFNNNKNQYTFDDNTSNEFLINNTNENSSMLNKKRNNLTLNYSISALNRRLQDFLWYIKKKYNKNHSVKNIDNLLKELEELKKNILKMKKTIKNQEIDENCEITDTTIKNLKETIESKIKNILSELKIKKTTKNNIISYKIFYEILGEENGHYVKSIIQNIANLKKLHKTLFNENHIIKNLISNIKTTIKTMCNDPEKPNEKAKTHIKFYYEKLTKTIKIYESLKKFNNKTNYNTFLKNLIKKYEKQLEEKIDFKAQQEDLTISPKFKHSPYYFFASDFRMSLSIMNIKIKEISPEIKEILTSLKLLYNMFCVLDYVNKNGNIKNKEAKKDMEFLKEKLTLETKYGIFLETIIKKVSNKNFIGQYLIKKIKDLHEIMENNPNKKTKNSIDFYYEKLVEIIKIYDELEKFNNKTNYNTFLKDLIKKYEKQLEEDVLNKPYKENYFKTTYPKFKYSPYYKFVNRFRNYLGSAKNIKMKNASPETKEMLDGLRLLYKMFCFLDYVDVKGTVKEKDALNDISYVENQLISSKKNIMKNENVIEKPKHFPKNIIKKISTMEKKHVALFNENPIIKHLTATIKNADETMKNNPNNATKLLIKFYYEKLFKLVKIYNKLEKINNKNNYNVFSKTLIKKYEKLLEKNVINKTYQENDFKNVSPKFKYSPYYGFAKKIRPYLNKYVDKSIDKNSNKNYVNIKEMLETLSLLYNIFCVLDYVNNEGYVLEEEAIYDVESLKDEIDTYKKEIRNNKK